MCDGSPILCRGKRVACLLTGMFLAGCSDADTSATSDRGDADASPAAISSEVSLERSNRRQGVAEGVQPPAPPAKAADAPDVAGEAPRPLLSARAMTGASLSLAIAENVREPGTHTVKELAELIQRDDRSIQYAAREALADLGPDAAAAIPALIAALEHEPSYTYWARRGSCLVWLPAHYCSAKILARIGPAAIPALVEALDDRSAAVRMGAVYALGLMGAPAEPAVAPILASMKAEDDRSAEPHQFRELAAWSLGKIGPAAALPALRQAQSDDNRRVRKYATEAIRAIVERETAGIGDQRTLPKEGRR
jgi:HEAT repeat protein